MGDFLRSARRAGAHAVCSSGGFGDGWQRPKPQPSPRERALELLDRISREIETLTPYQFSIRVSDILRRYVTEQYQLPVTRQTSVEFLAALTKASPFSEDEKSLLEDFLESLRPDQVCALRRDDRRQPAASRGSDAFCERRAT